MKKNTIELRYPLSSIYLSTLTQGEHALDVVADAVEDEELTYSGAVALMVADWFIDWHDKDGEERAASIGPVRPTDSPVVVTVDLVEHRVIVNVDWVEEERLIMAGTSFTYDEFVALVKYPVSAQFKEAPPEEGEAA